MQGIATHQGNLFGVSERIVGWKTWLAECFRTIPMYDGEDTSSYNRRIYAAVLTKDPVLEELAAAALMDRCEPKELVDMIGAWMRSPQYPAPDTVPRAIREAKAEMKKGFGPRPTTLNQMLSRIRKRTSEAKYNHQYSEPIVHDRLTKAFPGMGWEVNVRFDLKGNWYEVDFVSRTSKISIEIDGFEFHDDAASFVRDRQKQRAMVLLGYRHLMYPISDLCVRGGRNRMIEDVASLR